MQVNELITALINAESNKEPINFIKDKFDLSEGEYYDIQKELVKQKEAKFNSSVAVYKISMTSSETQAIANTHEPAYGTFLAYQIQKETEEINLTDLLDPLLEPEIVFQLNEDLSSDADYQEVIEKSTIYLGAEIPDSRYSNWFPNFSLTDLICDNAFSGRLILSEDSFAAEEVAFEEIDMQLYHNNKLIEEGASKNVLGNPINSIIWLNNKHISQGYGHLTKGLKISSGTLSAPVRLQPGEYKIVFSGLGTMKLNCL